ncbi:MAG: ATP-binding protein, partial [Phycisphaerae bacterium]
ADVTAPYEALGISITVQMEPAQVDADRMRLGQVLRNLISNAEKHGGANVRVTGRSEGVGYVIRVTDDGPGVPAEYRDNLFQRYIHQGSTPLQTGSVGLGLANAQMMTTKMGGSLTYLRDAGLTVFEVRLAIAKPPSDEAAIQAVFEAAGPRDPWLSDREFEQRASQRQTDAGTQNAYPLRPVSVGTSGIE